MEHVAPRPQSTVTAPALPPGSRLPGLVQGLRYARDPIGFFTRLRRRHGNVFSLSFPYFGRIVYVADPGIVKQVFTGDPTLFHAGEANATVLEPTLGPNSVLTLDEDEHLRQRKLLLPPFHGESVSRYGELIRQITERDMESWPIGRPFALRPHTQRITLDVILRAVFGVRDEERFRAPPRWSANSPAGPPDHADPVAAPRPGPVQPVVTLRAGARCPGRVHLRGDRCAAGGGWRRRARRRALTAVVRQARRRQPDERPGASRRARDRGRRGARDHRHGARLDAGAGAPHTTGPGPLAGFGRGRRGRVPGRDDQGDAARAAGDRGRGPQAHGAATVGGYELPAGTFVLPAIAALHYRADLYPDPQEFRPERFLDGKVDHYGWIPFGGGVRRCIGAAFAQYEMRVVLRAILERAELRAPDLRPERVKIRNVTLAPGDGCRVVLERPLAS